MTGIECVMVFIIGASSLRNTIEALPYQEKRNYLGHCYYEGGLSFNPRNRNPRKVLQTLLSGGSLSKQHKLVIWHDLINNTVTPFHDIPPCPTPELLKILKVYKKRIAAIVYIRRFGSPEILRYLRGTGIVVIDAFKQLISHRNRKDDSLINNLRELHPKQINEARILKAFWNNSSKLEKFGPEQFKNKKRKRPSQKQRRKKREKTSL